MSSVKSSQSQNHTEVWECTLADLKIETKGLSLSGSPELVDSPYGKALCFNGENDGIFLAENPLMGLSEYSIEVLMRPDLKGPEEQRFLHIGESDSDRLLLETRSTADDKWYLDTFIFSSQEKKAVIDPALVHPIGQWYHVALTVDKNGKMKNYVNGKFELEGEVASHSIKSGVMSIGVRQNKISWYKGAICKIRISPKVLEPKDFMAF